MLTLYYEYVIIILVMIIHFGIRRYFMQDKISSLIIKISAVIAIAVIIAAVFAMNPETEPVSFTEWTSSLVPDKIEYAEVSRFFGENKLTYAITHEEYTDLSDIFSKIADENCFINKSAGENKDGYRLELHRDEKLWIFKAMDDGTVSLIFNDEVTGAYYGCRDTFLTIESNELWNYIVKTADSITVSSDISASSRISSLEMREIRRVHTKISDINPDENVIVPLLQSALKNTVDMDEKLTYGYEVCVDTLYYITKGEKIVLNAGTEENYVNITYYVSDSPPQSFIVKDSDLYQYIRNLFTRDQSVDESYAQYSDVIDHYMKEFIEQHNLLTGAGFTDYVLCGFKPLTEIPVFSRHYKSFLIDIALYAEKPMNVYDGEDIWLDSDYRIRDYMKNILFFVETNGDSIKYKFLPETSHMSRNGGSWNYIAEEFDKTDEAVS